MSNPSRDTFQSTLNFSKVLWIENRDVLDSELNELQDNISRQFNNRDGINLPNCMVCNPSYSIDSVNKLFTINHLEIRSQGFSWVIKDRVLNFFSVTDLVPSIILEIDVFRRDATTNPDILKHPETSLPVAERLEWVFYFYALPRPANLLQSENTLYIDLCQISWATSTLTWGANIVRGFDVSDKSSLDRHLLPEIEKPGIPSHDLVSALNPGFMSVPHFTKVDTLDLSVFSYLKAFKSVYTPYNTWYVRSRLTGYNSMLKPKLDFNEAWQSDVHSFMGTRSCINGALCETDRTLFPTYTGWDDNSYFLFFLVKAEVIGNESVLDGATASFQISKFLQGEHGGDVARVYYHHNFYQPIIPGNTRLNLPPDINSVGWERAEASVNNSSNGTNFITEYDSVPSSFFLLPVTLGFTYSVCFVTHQNGFDDNFYLNFSSWLNVPPILGDTRLVLVPDPDYLTYIKDGGRF